MGRKEIPPRVSIVVVNWNGERLLENCLKSLVRQTYPERQIIVVDNGSTDGSVSLVKNRFPAVEVVELAKNEGFTGGNRAALRCAEGEYIALVNNDAQPDEIWLQNLIQPMLGDARLGMCASKILFEGTNEINSAGGALTTAAVGFDRGSGESCERYVKREWVFGACGAAVLYRREMIEDVGFLDEDFFLYGEDADLSFRAQLAGWKCLYVPDAIVYHKSHATSGRLSDLHVYHHTRNLEFVWVKNMPLPLMLRFAHHKLIQEIGSFCYLCLRRMQWRPFFRAKRDALLMLPGMLKKRKDIQKKKRVTNRYIRELLTPIYKRELLKRKVGQFVWGR